MSGLSRLDMAGVAFNFGLAGLVAAGSSGLGPSETSRSVLPDDLKNLRVCYVCRNVWLPVINPNQPHHVLLFDCPVCESPSRTEAERGP